MQQLHVLVVDLARGIQRGGVLRQHRGIVARDFDDARVHVAVGEIDLPAWRGLQREVQFDAARALLAALQVEDLHRAGGVRPRQVVDDPPVAQVEEAQRAADAAVQQHALQAQVEALAFAGFGGARRPVEAVQDARAGHEGLGIRGEHGQARIDLVKHAQLRRGLAGVDPVDPLRDPVLDVVGRAGQAPAGQQQQPIVEQPQRAAGIDGPVFGIGTAVRRVRGERRSRDGDVPIPGGRVAQVPQRQGRGDRVAAQRRVVRRLGRPVLELPPDPLRAQQHAQARGPEPVLADRIDRQGFVPVDVDLRAQAPALQEGRVVGHAEVAREQHVGAVVLLRVGAAQVPVIVEREVDPRAQAFAFAAAVVDVGHAVPGVRQARHVDAGQVGIGRRWHDAALAPVARLLQQQRGLELAEVLVLERHADPLAGLPPQRGGKVARLRVVRLPVVDVLVVRCGEAVAQRARDRPGHVGLGAVLSVGAEPGPAGSLETRLRALGDDVDDAAGCHLPVQEGRGTLDHLHAGDVGEVEDRGAGETVAQDLRAARHRTHGEAADREVGIAFAEVVASVGHARRVAGDVMDVARRLVPDEGLRERLDGKRQLAHRGIETRGGHGVRGAVATIEMARDLEGRDGHVHQLGDVHVGHVPGRGHRRAGIAVGSGRGRQRQPCQQGPGEPDPMPLRRLQAPSPHVCPQPSPSCRFSLGASGPPGADMRQARRNDSTPASTSTVPAARRAPNSSFSHSVPSAAANSTEVSRSAATVATGACVIAHSAIA